ncbi:IucA/IucC family protein [Pseudomonas rhizoryzae]|uniref:IucA/IucC family protein n=1 Tax=Pseudomonas rhizoryzae TaxID=2571129 RepID=UPI0010C1B64D|nr:IucA/IucC family protein [Pseudomonas rhizoryzae]
MSNPVLSQEDRLHVRWQQALTTRAFQDAGIDFEQLRATLLPARARSLQRLLQAVLRETLVEFEFQSDGSGPARLLLPDGSQLLVDQLTPGRMDSWDLCGSVRLQRPAAPIEEIQWPSQLLARLSEHFAERPGHEALQRLAEELDDSFINDTLCLAFNAHWSQALQTQHPGQGVLAGMRAATAPANPTLQLEQWGTLGHPWHPNYKTKLGLDTARLIDYAPEFAARIEVRLCALHRQYAHVQRLPGTPEYQAWWDELFPEAATRLRQHLRERGLNSDDYWPLPVHPWQAADVLPRDFAAEIADRLLVLTDIPACEAAPTMSFRTVLPAASRTAPMLKLPVSLRLTSVQRTVSPRSARMGPRVSELLLRILQREPALHRQLDIIPERLGLHYQPQPADDERARHLGLLYRDNPWSRLAPGELAVPVGSLFARDEQQRPLLREWVALATGRDDGAAFLAFFADYLAVAVPALLGIYLQYGVAFEAHQQNSFMVMGASGRPVRLLLRDFGDIRIDRATLHRQGLDLELHDPTLTLFDDASFVRDKLLHTTFMCHLGELALLGTRFWQLPEAQAWQLLADTVARCFEELRPMVEPQRWHSERTALLEAPWPAKAFLRMRLLDCQNDVVGRLANPLRTPRDDR